MSKRRKRINETITPRVERLKTEKRQRQQCNHLARDFVNHNLARIFSSCQSSSVREAAQMPANVIISNEIRTTANEPPVGDRVSSKKIPLQPTIQTFPESAAGIQRRTSQSQVPDSHSPSTTF